MSLFVKVGNFAKSTGVAPATQAISGLGFQPKALILWTSGGTVDGTIQTQATRDARVCIGIVSGTAAADQYAVATEADTAGNGGRRHSQKAFLLVDSQGATVVSVASLSSFDSDGFTLSWTTNSVTEAQIIHYLAIGGSGVQAKVVSLTTPAGTGNFSTTGVGFQPNLLLTAGPVTSLALDQPAFNSILRVGAAVSSTSRWAASLQSIQLVSSQGWRWHRNDRLLAAVSTTGTSSAEVDLVSMDADGFTLNQVVGASLLCGLLCLQVPNVAVGTFTKPTGGGPVAGSVTGLSFRPLAVLLASDQDINRANASSQTGARLGFSAFTDGAGESSVFSIPNAPNPFTYAFLEKSVKGAVKIDNATPAIDAESTGVLDGGGFTLTWNANDAVATEYGYVAIGDSPLPKGMGRVTQRRHFANRSRMPRGAWRRRSA